MGKREFLAEIRAARSELQAVLGRSDERTLATATVPGMDWTAKDVLAHLIGYDLAILAAIADLRAGRTWTWGWTGGGFDSWNESTVGPRRARPFGAVLAELEASRTALLQELESWPEDRGPFGADTWNAQTSEIAWVGSHEREHAEMIAKLAASA